eukprot:CAMPEP_0116838550 /NCGR_PEP_ID=MMETSP0418-20121206/9276_1 /TAXON_ID=1158023 /ORGANISM="Astrosyne radiata, Strain 13vi08-1A" /LENGTH=243 /DNA_ID=CAMNT_0004468567 /DNA_START=806 /DNA_END=1534 /DNA_ORIENTATION=+
MNVVAEIGRINEAELAKGIVGGLSAASWHSKYAHSAWIYMGNLPKTLTEGDVICIASQYGEVEDLHLVRHDETGESRGFAFLKYEDACSCILAVDNFTGSKVLGRTLRVDHVENYRLPKEIMQKEENKKNRTNPGHAYADKELANSYSLQQGPDLFDANQIIAIDEKKKKDNDGHEDDEERKQSRKEAKHKRKEERAERRKERDRIRQEREERRRKRRAKHYTKDENNDDDNDDDEESWKRRK